jgi:Protein of unknown function (DUF3606)
MADNKDNRGQQDRIRVDANDSNEVEFLHRKFPGKSHAEIKKAIEQNGPFRDDIERALRGE